MPEIKHIKQARIRKEKDGTIKPNLVCELDGTEIHPGQPYKNVSVFNGRSSTVRVRCESDPDWHIWELSSSLSARIAQIQYDFDEGKSSVETQDDLQNLLEETASAVRDLASEKQEAASNIVDGFGHDTQQSEELQEIADNLEGWADEIESSTAPEFPEPEEIECEDCDATGKVAEDGPDSPDCETCQGTGTFTPDEPTQEQLDDWLGEVNEIEIESPV